MMNYATIHFDTHKVVKLLREKGYTAKQAEGFIEAVQEVTLSGVATKEDIHNLETKMLKYIFANTVTLIAVMVALAKVF